MIRIRPLVILFPSLSKEGLGEIYSLTLTLRAVAKATFKRKRLWQTEMTK